MSKIGTIRSYPNNPRAIKAHIAAAYNGLEIESVNIDLAKDRDAQFFKKFPLGKVPVFESPEVNLFESTAIGFYAAALKEDSPLLGKTAIEKALIMQYVYFSEYELTAAYSEWMRPLLGYETYTKYAVENGYKKFSNALEALNTILRDKTYLVGEQVTYADISAIIALVRPFSNFLDKEMREKHKNVTRYFTTLVNQNNFKRFIGEIEYCQTPLKYNPPKKESKKEAPSKKESKPKEKPAPADEEEPKPAPKPKSKLDLLPPSSFILDAWKREYSNNDTKDAIKWFWSNFDCEGFSIWKVDYKYNNELTKCFMSNNLIGGFYARLERAHKYAFGSMIVRGTDNDNSIGGYFVIRGQEVPFEIYDAADYPSYNFTKIEPAQYEEKKKEFYKYLSWDFEDCVDGKVFK